MKNWNKKGMLDDVLDMLALIIVPMFGLLFLNLIFNQNIIDSHEAAIADINEFKRIDSATSNLLVQIQSGETVDPNEIDKLVEESKVLGGRTITNCRDYWNQDDCTKDTMDLHPNSVEECFWQEEKEQCIYFRKVRENVR